MEWYLKVVRDNYANFSGRARRKEYWMFALLNIVFLIMAIIIDNILGTTFGNGSFFGWIYMIYALALAIPGLAVSIRRLHDIGKSGWWLLLAIIPFVGALVLLVFVCTDGNPEENIYGPSPKAIS